MNMSWYIKILNHYVVHQKQIYYYRSIILHLKRWPQYYHCYYKCYYWCFHLQQSLGSLLPPPSAIGHQVPLQKRCLNLLPDSLLLLTGSLLKFCLSISLSVHTSHWGPKPDAAILRSWLSTVPAHAGPQICHIYYWILKMAFYWIKCDIFGCYLIYSYFSMR